MKKPEINLFKIAGAALVIGSTVVIADYAIRKTKFKTASTAELILGIAGVLTGSALVAEPEIRSAHKKVVVDDLFNDEDAELVNDQIRETLNKDPETVTSPSERLRTIEVDDETSIEDFI